MPVLYFPTSRLSAAVCCEVDVLEAVDASADGAGWAAGAIGCGRVEIGGNAVIGDEDMTHPFASLAVPFGAT
jgi:hypothetical protein